jgi:hypothetical protein
METKKTARPFSLAFVIPGTDEAEIRGQFSRFKREFSPSRIEIRVDSEKGISIATVEFPPTEEGRRSFEAYQKMRLGKVQVLRDEEKPMANLKTMTPHQLAEKMVLRMKSDLRLDDDQINAASVAVMQAWTRVPYCHVHFDNAGTGRVYEILDTETFVMQHVAATDENLLDGLEQYESAGMTKFVLYSSPHASMLWAAAGRK